MAFENRKGHSYFYRKERDGKRVVSKYIGKGELVELLSQFDEFDKENHEYEARKQRREQSKIEEIDRNLAEIERKMNDLIENFLKSKGFYKTKSREWRLNEETFIEVPVNC
jgi:hypothetical protein